MVGALAGGSIEVTVDRYRALTAGGFAANELALADMSAAAGWFAINRLSADLGGAMSKVPLEPPIGWCMTALGARRNRQFVVNSRPVSAGELLALIEAWRGLDVSQVTLAHLLEGPEDSAFWFGWRLLRPT